jgi:D-aminopeptidase
MASPREDGIVIGQLEPGPRNSIADVGVMVGHVTVEVTGVTALAPPLLPAPAGTAVLNGAGELTGSLQIREWGLLETPVYLTSTHAVGRVYEGAVQAAIGADPRVGVADVVIPVVGECDDSWLSDARLPHVQPADVERALEASSLDFEQGAVGAGKGMVCFDWKGGIGSSSRRAGDETVGVLVLANFGSAEQLRVDGVPVGRLLAERGAGPPNPRGSCIVVVATDAPLAPSQLERLARRAGLGLARTGSVAHHGSGEIFVAFATSGERSSAAGDMNALFQAAVDATEEAVLSALWSAVDTAGREGRVVPALPTEKVLELYRGRGL